jgi:dolichol-phosphate mannosyltransferase
MKVKATEQLSMVIPMYNEEENVEPLITEVVEALAMHPDFEIIVVDDGSQDATPQKLQQLTDKYSQLRVLRHRSNLGQSVGIFSGVRAAAKPWMISFDGDGEAGKNLVLNLLMQFGAGFYKMIVQIPAAALNYFNVRYF